MAMQGCSPKTVLVVEDDPILGDLIAAVLESEGFCTIQVHNGEEVLLAARELRLDAITLDLDLPGMDGRTILRRLHETPEDRWVPVVVVSSSSEMLSSQERREVAGTVAKPFLLPDLVDAVSSAVRHG